MRRTSGSSSHTSLVGLADDEIHPEVLKLLLDASIAPPSLAPADPPPTIEYALVVAENARLAAENAVLLAIIRDTPIALPSLASAAPPPTIDDILAAQNARLAAENVELAKQASLVGDNLQQMAKMIKELRAFDADPKIPRGRLVANNTRMVDQDQDHDSLSRGWLANNTSMYYYPQGLGHPPALLADTVEQQAQQNAHVSQ